MPMMSKGRMAGSRSMRGLSSSDHISEAGMPTPSGGEARSKPSSPAAPTRRRGEVAVAGEGGGVGGGGLALGGEGRPPPVFASRDVLGTDAREGARPRRLGEPPRERRAHPLDHEPLERLAIEGLELGLPHLSRAHGHRV